MRSESKKVEELDKILSATLTVFKPNTREERISYAASFHKALSIYICAELIEHLECTNARSCFDDVIKANQETIRFAAERRMKDLCKATGIPNPFEEETYNERVARELLEAEEKLRGQS